MRGTGLSHLSKRILCSDGIQVTRGRDAVPRGRRRDLDAVFRLINARNVIPDVRRALERGIESGRVCPITLFRCSQRRSRWDDRAQ